MKKKRSIDILFDKIRQAMEMAEKLPVRISLILILTTSIAYFYFYGEGLFFFQENKSLFIFSNEYLWKYLMKPGGLLEYSGNFLTQYYYSDLYGSLINVACLILVFLVFLKTDRRLRAGSFSILLILIPSFLLFFIQISYIHSIHNSLGYFLLALYFYTSIVTAGSRSRFFCLALFPVFFYLTGSFALIYPLIYIVYSIVYKKGVNRYLEPVFMIVTTGVTFIIFKEILFFQPADQLLRYPLPFIEVLRIPVLYNILFLYMILFPVLTHVSGLIKLKAKYTGFINLTTFISIFAITVIQLSKNYDPDLAILFKIEKSVFKQDWNSIIRQHETSPSIYSNGQYYYNLALSEKGQLCSRLFYGRQDFGSKSLILPRDYAHLDRAIYYYYSIGLISEAHRLAYESMVKNGYRPENIKMLIKTELINGNYKIASGYINILKKTSHYKKWAAKYEKLLNNPELIKADPELGEKIRSIPDTDFFIMSDDIDNIDMILKANHDNKKAFEYKIAWLLFKKDTKSVLNEVKKMKAMGYMNIPRHIEEAIVLYMYFNHELPDLGDLIVSMDTELRFSQYIATYLINSENNQILEREMKKIGEKTFWYYYQFR
jgi:hypothetical protein